MRKENKIQEMFEKNIENTGCISLNWEFLSVIFFIGKSLVYQTNIGGREIHIEQRMQVDGNEKWAVKMENWVLGKDNKYHYEPLPSSRTDDFINNTRFDSKEQAIKNLIIHENEFKNKPQPKLYL